MNLSFKKKRKIIPLFFFRLVSAAAGGTIQTSILVTLMLVILLNLSLSVRLSAQRNDIKFECISVEQGLSQSYVYSIIQDRQGFMWFATANGLNRYDGYSFTVYKPDPLDSTSLSGIVIYGLLENHFGNIWVATRGEGLNRFNRETEQFTHYKHDPDDQNSLSHNELSLVYEDRSGILWIGTYGGGLNKFDRKNDRFIHYNHDPNNSNSLSGNYVSSIFEDRSGRLWIGTASKGLNKFDRETEEFIHYKHDPDNPKSLSNDLHSETGCSSTIRRGSKLYLQTEGTLVRTTYYKRGQSSNLINVNRCLIIIKEERYVLYNS